MNKNWIRNKDIVATSDSRKIVIDLIETAFSAIDTESIIRSSVFLEREILQIKNHKIDVSEVDNIYIVGFGKASCVASGILDEILGSSIKDGVAIGLAPVACEYIQTYGGTHPHPSVQNVALSEKILELSNKVTDRDVVIVVVSGGGSALLCWPIEECHQSNRLYKEFLPTGGDIKSLNTIRKHISQLKGGGLAKHLYPAQVIGLIFSDVPGDNFQHVASGPTYKDETTIADAQKILDTFGLSGYTLNETPKDEKYFERVTNIPMTSNIDAVHAMKLKAESAGLKVKLLSTEMYDSADDIARQFLAAAEPGYVVLGAGEPKTMVTHSDGTGGRCQRLGMEILPMLKEHDVFAAFASDGLDNSPVDGVILDATSQEKVNTLHIDYQSYKEKWDSLNFFKLLENALLETGATGANVSDIMMLYRK